MLHVLSKTVRNKVHRCSVPKCRNFGGHRFPKDEALKREWLIVIRKKKYQPNWSPCESSRVCRKHFKESDFLQTSKNGSPLQTYRLKPGTIPSKFSWTKNKIEDYSTTLMNNINNSVTSLTPKKEVMKPKSKSKTVTSMRSSFLKKRNKSELSMRGKAEAFFTRDRSKKINSSEKKTEAVITGTKKELRNNSEVSASEVESIGRNENQDISNWEYRVIKKESLHLEEILGKIEYVFSLQDLNGRELEEKELDEIISSFPPLKPPDQVLPLRSPNRRSRRNIKT